MLLVPSADVPHRLLSHAQGEWEKALSMLEEIRAAGIKVSGMAYSAAIKVCICVFPEWVSVRDWFRFELGPFPLLSSSQGCPLF